MDIPDEEIGRFIEHLRLSIRLGGGSGGVPVGQFGGSPRLPVDGGWPPHPQGGLLPFVFSVDCAALPRVDGFALPADGSLLFFLDHEEDYVAGAEGERGFARVMHVPAGTDTAVAEPPDSGLVDKQYDVHATLVAELPDWFAPDEDEDEDDPSPFRQELARDLERDFPHLEELCALVDELWPPGEGLASAYIGGYADDEVMMSIAEQTLAGREKAGEIVIPMAEWYSQVEKEQHRLTSEWLSLASFLTADDYHYGSFAIRHDDLAAGRLDKAYSVTTFTE